MKIAISGTAGTGKSTLCNYINSNYGIPIVDEVARRILTDGSYTWMDIQCNITLFLDFQKEILNEKVKLEDSNSDFVCDRTILETLIYLESRLARIPYDILEEKLTSSKYHNGKTVLDVYNEYKDICMNRSLENSYDAIIYIHPNNENEIEADGIRNPNYIYNKQVHKLIHYGLITSPLKNKIFDIYEYDRTKRLNEIDKIMIQIL